MMASWGVLLLLLLLLLPPESHGGGVERSTCWKELCEEEEEEEFCETGERLPASLFNGTMCEFEALAAERFERITLRNEQSVKSFLALPRRTAYRPYIVRMMAAFKFGKQRLSESWESVLSRDDVVLTNLDLGDQEPEPGYEGVGGHAGGMIRGIDRMVPAVTDFSWKLFGGGGGGGSRPARFMLSFVGSCVGHDGVEKWGFRSHARSDLARLFRKPPASVKFVCNGPKDGKKSPRSKETYEDVLSSSNFSLVVHGHNRYSHRFVEAVGACSVPVIVADRLTLPCDRVIDWEPLVVRIPESEVARMRSPTELLARLPPDVERRRNALCRINDAFAKTHRRRALCVALDASIAIKKKTVAVLVTGQARSFNATFVYRNIYEAMVAPIRENADVFFMLDAYWSTKPRRYPERKVYGILSPEIFELFKPKKVGWHHVDDRSLCECRLRRRRDDRKQQCVAAPRAIHALAAYEMAPDYDHYLLIRPDQVYSARLPPLPWPAGAIVAFLRDSCGSLCVDEEWAILDRAAADVYIRRHYDDFFGPNCSSSYPARVDAGCCGKLSYTLRKHRVPVCAATALNPKALVRTLRADNLKNSEAMKLVLARPLRHNTPPFHCSS